MDGDSRSDPHGLQALVILDPVAKGWVEKSQMIEAGGTLRLFDQTRDLSECYAMMLFVISHENQEIILVHDLGIEHSLVPFHHLFQASGTEHCVRKLHRCYTTSSAAIFGFAAHTCSSS